MWTHQTHADDKPVMITGRERWPVATLVPSADDTSGARIQIVPFLGAWVSVLERPGQPSEVLTGATITAEIHASIDWAHRFMQDIGGAPADASMAVEQLIGDDL